jgi:aryl-alcohol dehydrogenase-like predicted oxidoreductase
VILDCSALAYSPLDRSVLSAAIRSPKGLAEDDWRRMNPRCPGEAFEKTLELVRRIEGLSAAKGCDQ